MTARLGAVIGLDDTLRDDNERLMRAVVAAEHVGHPVPCRSSGTWLDWTADDIGTQRTAARACAGCPAIDICRRYGRRYPRERGVLGGMTETERRTAAREAA